jgi:hypothetical protein
VCSQLLRETSWRRCKKKGGVKGTQGEGKGRGRLEKVIVKAHSQKSLCCKRIIVGGWRLLFLIFKTTPTRTVKYNQETWFLTLTGIFPQDLSFSICEMGGMVRLINHWVSSSFNIF